MTATYDQNMLLARDRVRFRLGDTDVEDPLLSNEEIEAVLSENSDQEDETIIQLAEHLAAKFARRVTMSVDGLSISYSDLSKRYSEMATKLKAQMSEQAGIGVPVVPGLSISEMDGVDANTDRPPSQFRVGMHDNPPGRATLPPETEL